MISLQETRVNGRFRLDSFKERGIFSEIYNGTHVHTNRDVAIKMENKKAKFPQVAFESQILRKLKKGEQIPELIWSGSDGDYNCLVLQKLGDNLMKKCTKYCNYSFSLKTCIILLDQIFDALQFIHEEGVVHRDIKPQNFCVGREEDNFDKVFLIDFGLSKIFYSEDSGHIEPRGGKSLLGDIMYASIANHEGKEQSRRDDLESAMYMIIHLMVGSLPWSSLAANKTMKHHEKS